MADYVQDECIVVEGIEAGSAEEPSKKKKRKPWHHERG